MEPEIICREAAFKHGATGDDIRWAFATAVYEGPLDEESGDLTRRALIGFDTKGNPIEVYYNDYGEVYNVFHAMRCRDTSLLPGDGND
jgi:hypothetical protein